MAVAVRYGPSRDHFSFLDLFMNRYYSRRSPATVSSFSFEQLEPRQMLAGNVSAYTDDGLLFVIGDSSPNIVKIVGTAHGVEVSGTDTTINGSQSAVKINGTFRHAFIQMNRGDDIATVQNLNVQKKLKLQGNAGSDELRVSNISAGQFETWLGVGDDVLEFQGVRTSGDIRVTMGSGNDIFSAENVVAGRQLKILGDAGNDLFAADDLYSKRPFQLDMGNGNDECVFAGLVDIWKTSQINLGNGHDFFAAVPNETNDQSDFRLRFVLDAGAGNDQVAFDSGVTLHKASTIQGGAGTDALQRGGANIQSHSQISHFESFQVPDLSSRIDAVVDRLLSEDLDPFERAQPIQLELDPVTQLVSVSDPSPTVSTLWDRAIQQAVINTAPGPTIASRAYAMLHTAMFDAWSAYDLSAISTVLADDLQRPVYEISEANKEQAMSYAGYRVAEDLFQSETHLFDALMEQLGYDPANQTNDITTAAGIGNVMARELIELRHRDGANQLGDDPAGTSGVAYSDITGYESVNEVGETTEIDLWTPERVPIDSEPGSENDIQEFLTPHWGAVDSFSLESGSEFRPEAPEPFLLVEGTVDLAAKTITLADNSVIDIEPAIVGTIINPAFIEQAERVVELSGNLTDEQKLSAEFWEDGSGTSFPPGTWMTFGQFTSARDNHTVDDDAKLFFALSNAVLDAGIATWDAKIAYDYARPVRVIRDLGTLGLIGEFDASLEGYVIEAWTPGGGTQTILAEDFLTYQTPGGDPSPPFGEYTSGHSAFSAAGAEILRLFTGSDFFGASVSFAPGESRFEPNITPTNEVTLAWDTYRLAADDAGISRLYGGIHFDDGDINGRTLGTFVGRSVWDRTQEFINKI